MPFVQGKCEACGGILTVDPGLKAANCPFCGSAYVIQDAINNYNTNIKMIHFMLMLLIYQTIILLSVGLKLWMHI